jgi:hypothetical protein
MPASAVPDRATLRDTLGTAALAVRLGSNLVWEQLMRPRATRADEIPRNYESVTPQWFGAVLCAETYGAEVTSVRAGRSSTGTSARCQFHIEYNDAGRRAGLPASVFAKGTPNLMARIAGTVSESMSGEAHFYSLIRPELRIEAPIGYHSAFDLRRGRSIHLLEDLVATKGATFCNLQNRVYRTQADEIVALLATLHGTYYNSPRLETEFARIPRWTEGYGRMVRAVDLKKYHHRGFEKAMDVIPEALWRRRDEVWRAIIRSTELHNALPHTIVHCDPHLGNWYTTVAGTMGLLDWQCLARGHWSRDLAYALSATLTIEDRRAWERDLIALYVDLFAVHSGVEIGFDEVWLRYRQQQFGALSFWTAANASPTFAPGNVQAPANALEMIRRFSHAIVDLESLDSL